MRIIKGINNNNISLKKIISNENDIVNITIRMVNSTSIHHICDLYLLSYLASNSDR